MAREKITMPQLGESVTEGTISKWLVQPGDTVKKYDPLAEVMTDKVNAEVPSSFSGTIKELVAGEGDTLSVGELICYIDTEGEGSGEASAASSSKEEKPAEKVLLLPPQVRVLHLLQKLIVLQKDVFHLQ